VVVSQWYNAQRTLLVATGTAVWWHSGIPPVPIRWVLVRDPAGEHEPSAFLCTDLDAQPAAILGWFVSRWRVETTFQEVRAHLGVEPQRQWSDLVILRTTPALLGLFSLITVWADGLARDAGGALKTHTAAWYSKQEPTFSDAIAAIRRVLWTVPNLSMSRQPNGTVTIPVNFRNSQPPPRSPRPRLGLRSNRRYPDNSRIRVAGGAVRVRRMFQPCLRAVESTERRVAKVSAPAQLRKPPDIFIFTFIIRRSCSA